MSILHQITIVSLLCSVQVWAMAAAESPLDKNVTADEIVDKCSNKFPGADQRSRLTIRLSGQDGRPQEYVYRRLWKSYEGSGDIADKMLLVTEEPPDSKGLAFMRWGYVPEASKHAEQWIYLPALKKIRRVSVQDLNQSFLGSDLTYGDISLRRSHQDQNKILAINQVQAGEYFVIESIPKESSSMYLRKIHWIARTPDWDSCIVSLTEYYDVRGDLLKKQHYRWRKVANAWVWDRVVVQNVQSFHTSNFSIDQVEINIGINDSVFTERSLLARQ